MAERLPRQINPEKLHISLLCAYPVERFGGVQANVRNLDKEYKDLGHISTIVAPYSQTQNHLDKDIIHLGLSHSFRIKGTSVETAILPDSNTLAVLRTIPTDIMDHQEPELYGVSYVALWMSRIYHFATYHSKSDYNLKYKPWQIINRLYSTRFTGKNIVSEANRKFVKAIDPKGDYEVIPNGVDTDRFNPKNKPIERFKDGKKNILFVGRLEERKGLNYLISALPKTALEVPNLRLIVVGEGPNKMLHMSQAESVSRATGVEVCFVGAVSAEDLPRYYVSADVFSSPAFKNESQGEVNHEGQASGVAVVSGDNDGYQTSVINGVDGILVDPKNTDLYSKYLTLVLTNENFRNGLIEQGLITAKNHDWSIIANRKIEFYLRKIDEKNSKRPR